MRATPLWGRMTSRRGPHMIQNTQALFSWLLVSSLALPVAAQEGAPPVRQKAEKAKRAADEAAAAGKEAEDEAAEAAAQA